MKTMLQGMTYILAYFSNLKDCKKRPKHMAHPVLQPLHFLRTILVSAFKRKLIHIVVESAMGATITFGENDPFSQQ